MGKILILGGTHGVEPQSSFVAVKIANHLKMQRQSSARFVGLFDFYDSQSISIIPDLNRFGLQNHIRGNEHGVDLNRNMPAKNWSSHYEDLAYFPGNHPASERQCKELVSIIKENNYDLFLSIHTNHFVRHAHPPQVNFDGIKGSEGHKAAAALAKLIELPLTDDIGYSTPGSLGSYAKDLGIPCITFEMDNKYHNEGAWGKYGNDLLKWIESLA